MIIGAEISLFTFFFMIFHSCLRDFINMNEYAN